MSLCYCQTYVESSQPDCHIVSFISWQRIPYPMVPFVHVLQRHSCIVLDNLGQGGALVKDHSKDDKLKVCSKCRIPVDGAEENLSDYFSSSFLHLTMLISVRMYWRTVSTPWKLMTVWSEREGKERGDKNGWHLCKGRSPSI